jgi:3-hydroxyacyl-CoA dehydrogenase/enoyl-CoA hydratase/3-hydroxybutyryl-CoA epimerase
VHVFHLLEGAKKAGPRGAAPRQVSRVAVLGAGVMGGGIAHLLAGGGITVRLKDIRTEALASGLRHARGLYEHAVQRRRLHRRELQRNMDRIAPTLEYTGFRGIDLVIEAVLERMDVKQQVLREAEAVVGRTARSRATPHRSPSPKCSVRWTGPRTSAACTSSIPCTGCRWWK